MSGFPILDFVIGIIFIYFLLSIICSSAVELWLTMRKTRARLLEQWLKKIFDSQALDSHGIPLVDRKGKPKTVGQEIMDHCMVTALSKTGKSTSYISAQTFVSALLDKITILASSSTTDKTIDDVVLPPENLKGYIEAIKNSKAISGELKRIILTLAYEARAAAETINTPLPQGMVNNVTTTIKSDIDNFRERLENWYDSNGDRLTGKLKRTKVLPLTIIIATIITVALNVDTIEISKYLYTNKDAAKQLATTAVSTYRSYEPRITRNLDSTIKPDTATINALNESTLQLKKDIDSLQALNLPIGWAGRTFKEGNSFWNYFFQWGHVFGWLATILAICMGAPFWFDLLNKIANLRGTGPKPVAADDSSKK